MIKTTNALDAHFPVSLDKDINILNIEIVKNGSSISNSHSFQLVEDRYSDLWKNKYIDIHSKLTDDMVDFLFENFNNVYSKNEIKNAKVEIYKMRNLQRIEFE